MATHSDMTKVISSIDLGTANGGVYEIHDAKAVHSVADLGLTGYLKFKGAVASKSALPTTGNEVGDVYHAVAEDQEYIWVADDSPAVEGHWEEFGSKLMVDHVHSLPSLSGSIGSNGSAAAQTWTQDTGTISGTAAAQTWTQGASSVTVAGSNSSSSVSGSGKVSVPTVSKTAKYAKVSTDDETFVKSYPGQTSKMETTSITGVSGSTTASKATAGAAVAVAKAGTAQSIPNVTGNVSRTATKTVFDTATSASKITATAKTASKLKTAGSVTAGTAPTWSASVANGVLSFSFGAGTHTAVTLPTFEDVNTSEITANTSVTVPVVKSNEEVTATNTTLGTAISVTPAVDNGSIQTYTFGNVTVPKAATSATTVATGALSTTAGGATVMTGLGTASTGNALTSASLAAGTTTDTYVGDSVSIGSEEKTVNISGTAAAQTWTQGDSSVTITGSNATSAVSGNATVTGHNTASKVTGSVSVTTTNKVTGVPQ